MKLKIQPIKFHREEKGVRSSQSGKSRGIAKKEAETASKNYILSQN